MTALAVVLAVAAPACSDRPGGASKASAPTASTGGVASATGAGSATGPVTEADVTEIDQVLRRLDGELDRLDSDMAAGEGETQQVALEARRRAATGAVTRRLLALGERLSVAASMVHLGEDHRATLTTQLQEQIDGLTGLGARIQGDNDEAALRDDAQRIVSDFRVYVLTIPRARGVMVADIELAAADRFGKLAVRLATAIGQSKGDTTDARADLAQMRGKATAVAAAVPAIAAQLLALRPAGFPANRAVLDQARQSLRTGRADLADASVLARRVIAGLQ
jgi:hypothetical protein